VTQAQKRRGPSTQAKAVFSLFLVVFVFGTAELAARVVGAGDPEAFGGSRLLYQHIYPPLYVETPKGAWRPRDPRLVDRPIPKAAPPRRIFVFGESAVAGLGMSENASFSRALERQLRHLGDSSVVANVGIVALDSRQVHTCVKDCCEHVKPDVVVLHVGNNEFLEPHALKFVEAKTGKPLAMRVDELFAHSCLFRALKNSVERARTAVLTSETFSTDSLQLSEDKLVREKGVTVSREEVDAAVSKHLANMKRTVELAKASGAKVVLMTVATNLEWSGSKDPDEGWLAKACGKTVPDVVGPERTAVLQAAQDALTKTVDDPSKETLDRWEARYERACVRRALGDTKGALDDFQKANDEDPHLRRCLSVMNENVRQLAKEEGVLLVDGAQVLAEASKGGITGFDMLYDYVHFTPAGAERLGAALALALAGSDKKDEIEKWTQAREEKLAARTQDALEVEEYLGWDADRALLSSRDLWKYEKLKKSLDFAGNKDTPPGKLQQGTITPEELVWCADGHALKVGEEKRARELYERARAAKPELGPVIDANLRWLDAR
jgi:lysophospholipase L1-like esterase